MKHQLQDSWVKALLLLFCANRFMTIKNRQEHKTFFMDLLTRMNIINLMNMKK